MAVRDNLDKIPQRSRFCVLHRGSTLCQGLRFVLVKLRTGLIPGFIPDTGSDLISTTCQVFCQFLTPLDHSGDF